MALSSTLTFCGVFLIIISMLRSSFAQKVCDDDWTVFGTSCYILLDQQMTYWQAVVFCNSQAANVVEINSEEENTFVTNFIRSKNIKQLWIGVNDIIQEGDWVYTESGRRLGYRRWEKHEPNNMLPYENCAELRSSSFWNDMPCLAWLMAVCEHPKIDN